MARSRARRWWTLPFSAPIRRLAAGLLERKQLASAAIDQRSADAVPPRTEPITRSGPYGATSLELSAHLRGCTERRIPVSATDKRTVRRPRIGIAVKKILELPAVHPAPDRGRPDLDQSADAPRPRLDRQAHLGDRRNRSVRPLRLRPHRQRFHLTLPLERVLRQHRVNDLLRLRGCCRMRSSAHPGRRLAGVTARER